MVKKVHEPLTQTVRNACDPSKQKALTLWNEQWKRSLAVFQFLKALTVTVG